MSVEVFKLPDLGEGLPDGEIVEWLVKVGDIVSKDQPFVSVETAKAVVEIPSPYTGTLSKTHGEPGDIVDVGSPLAEFEVENAPASISVSKDKGTVVGSVKAGDTVVKETASATNGKAAVEVKAMPAVRALAKRMNVDLQMVRPSGPNHTITAADVQRVAKKLEEVGPLEPLRGVRRAMARTMSQAQQEVVPVTVHDDANIQHWSLDEDMTIRLIRAIVAGCRIEPGLNAWFDSHAMGRHVLEKIDLGIAMDIADGLFVPVLRDVGNRDDPGLRKGLEAMKHAVRERNIPPEELRGSSFTLSNFGAIGGGRYASPIVVPPALAILGAGAVRDEVVAVNGQAVVNRIMPLSLTFDHRCVTGGEATRFLVGVIQSLES